MADTNPQPKAKAKSGALYALGRVDHDGKTFLAGEQLPAMDAEQQQALIASGVVSAVAPQEDPPAVE